MTFFSDNTPPDNGRVSVPIPVLVALIELIVFLFFIVGLVAMDASQSIPPCATEDSDGCYWDADTMGNGEGHDSVVMVP